MDSVERILCAAITLSLAWFLLGYGGYEGYKQGQIDALNGKVNVCLETNECGEVSWEYNK